MTTPLDRAVKACGGVSALASALGVAASAPSMWRRRGNVPAEHCPSIERATGGAVRCEDLRPDVDWGVLRQPAVAAATPIAPGDRITDSSADRTHAAADNGRRDGADRRCYIRRQEHHVAERVPLQLEKRAAMKAWKRTEWGEG